MSCILDTSIASIGSISFFLLLITHGGTRGIRGSPRGRPRGYQARIQQRIKPSNLTNRNFKPLEEVHHFLRFVVFAIELVVGRESEEFNGIVLRELLDALHSFGYDILPNVAPLQEYIGSLLKAALYCKRHLSRLLPRVDDIGIKHLSKDKWEV